jgi:hypothetical protein
MDQLSGDGNHKNRDRVMPNQTDDLLKSHKDAVDLLCGEFSLMWCIAMLALACVMAGSGLPIIGFVIAHLFMRFVLKPWLSI